MAKLDKIKQYTIEDGNSQIEEKFIDVPESLPSGSALGDVLTWNTVSWSATNDIVVTNSTFNVNSTQTEINSTQTFINNYVKIADFAIFNNNAVRIEQQGTTGYYTDLNTNPLYPVVDILQEYDPSNDRMLINWDVASETPRKNALRVYYTASTKTVDMYNNGYYHDLNGQLQSITQIPITSSSIPATDAVYVDIGQLNFVNKDEIEVTVSYHTDGNTVTIAHNPDLYINGTNIGALNFGTISLTPQNNYCTLERLRILKHYNRFYVFLNNSQIASIRSDVITDENINIKIIGSNTSGTQIDTCTKTLIQRNSP